MAIEPSQSDYAKKLLGQFATQILDEGMKAAPDKGVVAMINERVADIDKILSDQMNAILHHPDFQALEASWRGLHDMVFGTETGPRLKLRLLNVSKKELLKDLETAVDHDMSALFKKVYEEEYGTFGGQPYSLLIAWQHLAAHPLAWGLRRLELDEGLLANGMVRIKVLEAVMPDGMAVTWSAQDAHAQELQLDLAPWAAQLEDGEVMVYLTVGYARTWRQPGQPSRFRPLPGQLEEDEVSEALPVDIPRAAINLALAAGALPSSVFVSLPLMTVQKDKEVFRRGPFVPPSLVLEANNELRQRAQALAAHLRSKAAYLVKQTSDPSSRVEDRLALLENRARLGSLVASLPVLEALLQAPGLSPYALYLSLCAQLGPLTMLRPGAVPIKLSPWVQG